MGAFKALERALLPPFQYWNKGFYNYYYYYKFIYINKYIHIRIYIHTLHTYSHACIMMHVYSAYIHTYIHSYIQTSLYTYVFCWTSYGFWALAQWESQIMGFYLRGLLFVLLLFHLLGCYSRGAFIRGWG